MPVTAKLSQKFYQRFGDDVANELVEWLNAVDTSYRQEFKDLFEANFGRVEARMDELRAEVRHEMGEVRSDLGRLESRVDAKIDGVGAETRGGFVSVESRMDAKLSELKSELLRWMFLFWVGTMGTVLAIVKL
jgi:hypothetical protein